MYSDLFEDLSPPVHGEIYTFAHTTTAFRRECPPDWIGNIVTISNVGTTELHIAFGDSGVMIGTGEYAVATGETLTPNMASGYIIGAGNSRDIPVGKNCTHFAADSAAASGDWVAHRSSGSPVMEEPLNVAALGRPLVWLDAARRKSFDSTTVGTWNGRVNGQFIEATNKPALLSAAAVAADLYRPAVSFTAGSSHKLVCSDATISAALGGTNPFTLAIAARRGAATALHTLFSVGTGASNNGRWDLTLDASDDIVLTRVTAAGASTTSVVTTTIASGEMHLFVITFDGTTPLLWLDRVSTALTGTAAGDVGTTTKVAVGCRAYNTSTFDQFATAQIPEVIVWNEAFSAGKLDILHAWLKRRYAK